MATDSVARGLGIAGAASGFLALAWNVISWRREGPVLKAWAAYVYGRGGEVQISGHIANRGRLQTTVTEVEVAWISTPLFTGAGIDHRFLVEGEVRGITLGQPMLPQTGSASVIRLTDAEDIQAELDKRQRALLRLWTATNQSTDVRIKYRKKHHRSLPRFY